MSGSKPETGELLALACKALTERFPEDPTRPGILVSHITVGSPIFRPHWVDGVPAHYTTPEPAATWYLAAHRYTGSFAGGRTIVAKQYNPDLDTALIALAQQCAPFTTDAQRDLQKALRGLV